MDLQTQLAVGIVALAAAELIRRSTHPWRHRNQPGASSARGCGSCAQCPSSQEQSRFGLNQATTATGLVSLQLRVPPAKQPT